MNSVLRGQRPWLAAGALVAMAVAALWPTRAVPFTSAEAAVPRTPDDDAAAADALAVRAVLRVSAANDQQRQRPTTA